MTAVGARSAAHPKSAARGSPCGALYAIAMVLAACSHTGRVEEVHRTVSQHVVPSPGHDSYQKQPHTKYALPEALNSNRVPEFPAVAREDRQEDAVTINVRLVVDTSGAVTEVHPLGRYDDARHRPFFDSVVAACMSWGFTPLQARRTDSVPDGTVFGEPKVKIVTITEPLPFSLDYQFSFASEVSMRMIVDE